VREQIIRRLADTRLPADVVGEAAAGWPRQTLDTWFRQPLRPAAVLLPLITRPHGLHLLLTERNADLPDHPGQIAFPGGSAEDQDADLEATALRESHEEVGLEPATVSIAGYMPAQAIVTGFAVAPVVGFTEPFKPQLDTREVAAVFEVPLDFLLDDANRGQYNRERQGITLEMPEYRWQDHRIWGATAVMIEEFIKIIR
jgi:8-oxo-dGTP pyrophosphatase MutT (NUDIX family)